LQPYADNGCPTTRTSGTDTAKAAAAPPTKRASAAPFKKNLPAQARQVQSTDRIAVDVGVQIRLTEEADGIGAQPTTDRGIVVTRSVVVEADLRVPFPTGECISRRGSLQRDSICDVSWFMLL
jgi:hypothetical protein